MANITCLVLQYKCWNGGWGGYVAMMVINTITPSQLKGNKQYIYGYGYY